MLMDVFHFFFKVYVDRYYDNCKGFRLSYEILYPEVFDGCSYFLDSLRTDIQNIQKIGFMGRFRPGMTSSKLLRNNMHHKTLVITLLLRFA